MIRELLDIPGLRDTSAGFRRRLFEVSSKNGLNPNYLAAVMKFESNFNPQAQNPQPHSTATGLIQFTPVARRVVGVTVDDLMSMTDEEQMEYVDRYFQQFQGKIRASSIEDHYHAVLGPKGIGKSKSFVLYSQIRDGDSYRLNKGLDTDKDGVITNEEAAAPVIRIVRAAEPKPRILIDDQTGEIVGENHQPPPLLPPPPTETASSAPGLIALLLGAGAGFMLMQIGFPALQKRFPRHLVRPSRR